MKNLSILVLSMMIISCGQMKPKAETEKKVEEATANNDEVTQTSEQITVCSAYQDLDIDYIEEVIVEKEGVQYITEIKPAVASAKLGTCHIEDFDWVELDSKVYDENIPKPESDEYKEMKASCQALKTDATIVKFSEDLQKQTKTLGDPQAKGILIVTSLATIDEEAKVLKCSTDFGVYQPAKIEKAQTEVKK